MKPIYVECVMLLARLLVLHGFANDVKVWFISGEVELQVGVEAVIR